MADAPDEGREGSPAHRLTLPVIWSPSALRQIARASDYLAAFNPRAAAELAARLLAAGDSLAHFPHRGRHVPNSDLRELVAAASYVIRYRVRHGTVRILRVRHTARRPTNP